MKRLLSFCLVLCVCSSLLISFSVTAKAEAFTDFDIVQFGEIRDKNNTSVYDGGVIIRPNNGEVEKVEDVLSLTVSDMVVNGMQYTYHGTWNIRALNGYPFTLGRQHTLKFENFYHRILLYSQSFGNKYVNNYSELYAVVTYQDGTNEQIEVSGTTDIDQSFDMSFSFTPEKNVSNIKLHVVVPIYENFGLTTNKDSTITLYFGEIKGDDKHIFNIDIQSEEAGLLSGVLGWVKNIFNKIGDIAQSIIDLPEKIWNFIKQGFEALGEGITNVWNTLIELPGKLWNLISEGLKFLFVPSEEEFNSMFLEMEELMTNSLGAVYQVIGLVSEFWSSIVESDATDSIEFPSTTINLPDGNEFTFGGYNVKVVPDGFDFITSILKSVVGIVCTLSFINALRKRYEDFMGD